MTKIEEISLIMSHCHQNVPVKMTINPFLAGQKTAWGEAPCPVQGTARSSASYGGRGTPSRLVCLENNCRFHAFPRQQGEETAE